jgi:protein-S-isoprenylcysteine O-methyltransferase Ste14
MLGLLFAVLFWGLLHSLFASYRIKAWTRQIFGVLVNRFYRLVYNLIACISFLPVLVVMFFIPDRTIYIIKAPWSWLLVMGEGLAIAALLIGFRQTDPREFLGLRQLSEIDKPSMLNTSGLYRYVRHPLYTAGLAFIWMMPVMTTNILGVNLGLTIYVIIGAYFEERKLQAKFGQEYKDYIKVTPMFIPFLKGNKSHFTSS